MKKSLFLFLIPLLFSCQNEKVLSKYRANIGDMEFDAKTDNPNFELCLPQLMFQYFNYGNELENLKGEKSISIASKIYNFYKPKRNVTINAPFLFLNVI
ncbi:hypothetical protein [Soonwooa sp.]|uniref:hypothetical protein n=1 Tax=Soonwooa sp. TaxID=1938592 RepID=UPI0035B18913